MADIPAWNNTGVEPSDDIKQNGFTRGYRPPAEYFNWFFNRTSVALSEITSPTKLEVGFECEATGENTVALGYQSKAKSDYSYAEGYKTVAGQSGGIGPITLGTAAHAEGYETQATGTYSHAQGVSTTAVGHAAHAEGSSTIANGTSSHAEGAGTTARGVGSHAEGSSTTASGNYSHAGGDQSTASGICSFAHGSLVTANDYNFVIGKWNKTPAATTTTTNEGDLFVIGSGLDGGAKANAFRVTAAGEVMGTQAYTASGADICHALEWFDGNPNNEDRRGLFVTLDGDKIRPATSKSEFVLGVISATPSLICNARTDEWSGKYETDEFGARIMVDGAYKLSDKFDEAQDDGYTSRLERKEWGIVGHSGIVVVRDDGTCEANSYCLPNDDGVATKSRTGYRVMKRISSDKVLVFVTAPIVIEK